MALHLGRAIKAQALPMNIQKQPFFSVEGLSRDFFLY
jgi:hypothetical protein